AKWLRAVPDDHSKGVARSSSRRSLFCTAGCTGQVREDGWPCAAVAGSDALRDFLAAKGLEQRRQEVAQGQHHQGEAGVQLAQRIVTAVLGGLVLQQVLEAQALDRQLVV